MFYIKLPYPTAPKCEQYFANQNRFWTTAIQISQYFRVSINAFGFKNVNLFQIEGFQFFSNPVHISSR